MQVLGAGKQDTEVARCMCGLLRIRGGASGVSLMACVWNAMGTLHRSLDKQVSVRVDHLGDGHQLVEVTLAVHAKPHWSCLPVALPLSYPP